MAKNNGICLHTELDKIRSQVSFMNDVNMAYLEAVNEGKVSIGKDFIYGQYLINIQIENDLKELLKKIES
jgi:hypothetical protein